MDEHLLFMEFIKLLFGIGRKGEKKLLCQSFQCHRQAGARQLLAVDALTSSSAVARLGMQQLACGA